MMSDPMAQARKALQSGKLEDALSLAGARLREEPDDAAALYLQAVAQRYLRRHPDALTTLEHLRNLQPDHARAFQEAGHNFRDLGDADRALAAYQRAVELNHALPAAWRELARLHRRQDRTAAADSAQAEYERLSKLPKELVSVSSLLHEGKLYKAETLCRAFLRQNPHHVEAMRLLAVLGMKLFIYDDAEFLLESCVEFEPENWQARYDYVSVLHKRQKFEKALEQATILRDAHPGNHAFDLAYANECVAVGQFDTALERYERITRERPNFEYPHLSRGHALKTIGRLDEAIESYRAAYRARPGFGDAYWSLANLKTYRFTDDELADMNRHVAEPATTDVDRFHLCFALGAAHESREDYAESFRWYEQGNRLKKAHVRYEPERLEEAMRRQIESCTTDLFERKSGLGGAHDDPIFIVGLPRAGSTLLEQILASHSQVDGTMELPNIIALAHRLNGRRFVTEKPRYPAILDELDGNKLRAMADAFIRDTQIHRQGAPRFIDKMPNNFMHIGLIHLMLPNARIIDARRHPMACCFSGFKQLFADGQEFTYGLEEVGRYYRGYVELMEHWDHVLPGRVLRVHYEHVVADLETQVRRILDFLGLPFEEACLNYHATDRSIRTPSSEQVRQPIYRSGLEHWRHFEPHLGPLRSALGDLPDRYPMPATD
ncbi:tetratricopeptide repeat-containing sulfotransferase family protein [Elongatibacter sediminis]|uniref:Sulfotransferase n=1 Tax=Elongatibacter sediminis TaxID=3119006 RepID=A0AAW9RGQ8_9GAMM